MPLDMNATLDRLVGRLEKLEALDRVAEPLAAVIGVPLRSRRLRSLLSGTPGGHSVHPMLVTAPIGAFLAASGLDWFGGEESEPAAERLVGLGLLSVLPAALTGATDWAYTTGAERRVGVVHALANWLAIAGYAASWQARRNGRQRQGAVLALGGATVMSVAGWLGGHLVYARGVGVDTTAFLPAAEEWTDVLPVAELVDSKPVQVRVAGVPVLLVRIKGQVLAIDDRCSHRGGPLHEGTLTGECISCPWHGGTFKLTDGSVVSGPATRPQRSWQVRVESGNVQLRVVGEQGSLRTNPVN
jgi:nitrite reductase/ring-hydroxylating ferredoxin subunit/uncharacterized membrane protein